METTATSEQIYRVLEEMGRRVRRVREEAEASLREAEREYAQRVDGELGVRRVGGPLP